MRRQSPGTERGTQPTARGEAGDEVKQQGEKLDLSFP